MIVRKMIGDVHPSKGLIILVAIGGLYSISAALSNTFVNIFLWKQSGSFYDIGVYNLSIVIFQAAGFIVAGKLTKSTDRVMVLRLGILFLAVFYCATLFSGENAADYIILLGGIQGTGYGFYWLAYNVLTFEITDPENRDFFNGLLGIMSSLGGMLGPFLAGMIITIATGYTGYKIIFGISLGLFAVAVILSFVIHRRPAKGKFDFVRILKERRNNPDWRRILDAHLMQGIREGTFLFIVSIFVFLSTGSEMSLGMFGLLNSGIGMLTYFAAAKFIKKEHRNKAILLGGIGLFLSIFLLIFELSYMKLLMYGVLIAIFYPMLLVPYVSLTYDVIGRSWKAAEKRVEYIVLRDLYVNIGRICSILIFLASITFFHTEDVLPYLLIVLGSGHLFIYLFVRKITLTG